MLPKCKKKYSRIKLKRQPRQSNEFPVTIQVQKQKFDYL